MTFSLLAVDAERGFLAAATASRSQAVGNSTLALHPQLGIVCTQAWTNRELKPWAMTALTRGAEAEGLVQALPDRDPDHAWRQFAVLTPDGRGDAATGAETTGWSGHTVRPGRVLLGNCLAGPEVLAAMDDALAPAEDFAGFVRGVMAAMRAGDEAGGDARGRQSAALLAARIDETTVPAELGGEHGRALPAWPPLLDVDLRVDDDPERPLEILQAMLESRLRLEHPGRDDALGTVDPAPPSVLPQGRS